MTAPVLLRSDFDAEALRALAKGSRDSAQIQRLLALSATYGHLEEFVLLGCDMRCWGERRFLRVLRGSSFQGSRLGGPSKG